MCGDSAEAASQNYTRHPRPATVLFREEFTEIGTQFDDHCRFAAAGRSGLDKHVRCNLTDATETLPELKPVGAAEAADRLAFVLHKGQRRMRIDSVLQPLELTVDCASSERRIEGTRVEEDIDVLRETLNEIPALGEARAPFENGLLADSARDDAQRFGNVVVLLYDRWPQSFAAKIKPKR